MPRTAGDRPLVIPPENTKNFAFIGNFSETEDDTVFTTEYSVRTAMEAVYKLLNVDRVVPEVFASAYDIRTLLSSIHILLDKKKIGDIHFTTYFTNFWKRLIKNYQRKFYWRVTSKSRIITRRLNQKFFLIFL